MTALILTIISTALINNVVLSQFMGLCPFLGVSKKTNTAAGMGAAVMFVITIASFITSMLYKYVLDTSLNLIYLETIVFILVIAALVQIVEMIIKKISPALYQSLGVYLPLITTNCAVLGVALTNVQNGYDILTSTIAGFGTAAGFAIAILIMAGVRERCEHNNIPKAFQGMPIVLITAGLMSIAFFGFKSLGL